MFSSISINTQTSLFLTKINIFEFLFTLSLIIKYTFFHFNVQNNLIFYFLQVHGLKTIAVSPCVVTAATPSSARVSWTKRATATTGTVVPIALAKHMIQ